MRYALTPLLGISMLSACVAGDAVTFDATPLSVQRFYAAEFQDQPFDEGAIAVVSAERGKMQTYTLTPCRGGTHICGTGQGHLIASPDYTIVTGAYHGRTFFLSPGGDGTLRVHGQDVPLAWEEAGVLRTARPR